jgi:misacylated tRNA(Ala) deacylase
LAARAGVVSAEHLGSHDLSFMQRVARELTSIDSKRAVLLTAGEGEVGFFLLAAGEQSTIDASELGPRIAHLLEGKGGGKGGVFQGRANRLSNREAAVALLG